MLVILGLLAGGILAGQSLIRAAELRAVTAEYQRYLAAVQSFRDKYMAVPGDMTNATAFWGTMTNCGVASPSGSGTQTCNGNGNGNMTEATAASRTAETFHFWKQLANAGLIEGSYNGIAGSGGTNNAVISTNAPSSKLGNGGWSVDFVANFAGDSVAYALDYQNYFVIGAQSGAGPTWGSLFSPEEAWNIDTKMDDGKPAYGNVIARYWNNACATGGATSADLANSVYNLSSGSISCALKFRRTF